MKDWIRTLIAKWNSETPLAAKRVRNAAGIFAAAIPSAYAAVTSMGIDMPDTIKNIIAATVFISVIIVGIAGTKETNNGKSKREKRGV